MRGLVLFIALCSCSFPTIQLVGPTDKEDIAVTVGVKRTLLMTEGCTAVSVGNGMVITAKHCVDELSLGDDTSIGMLVYISPNRDFAIAFDTGLLHEKRVCMRRGLMGERVYAIGWPTQVVTKKQALTVTDGVVAGPTDDEGNPRITAPIFFGNSGGGAWATDGCLVGITVSGVMSLPGVAFMVDIEEITPWLPR